MAVFYARVTFGRQHQDGHKTHEYLIGSDDSLQYPLVGKQLLWHAYGLHLALRESAAYHWWCAPMLCPP